ncbi:imidazole glycerol phosphate synthase subunit HisH [Pseudomonas sp. JS3066]|uniref:imidazole glycerol phosphate synthase subunit HisH n=1 Tax=Pseudomonas sp. JS3066 TaxID=3090665 RepID=UPI002E7C5376|nr:imidazole glycerol phosphate synthase subunit HisH [Pseudomonas sp. JS3066]WVK95001.1 imidazole glycerol phosphate synthase subunit HisH [Pseudomonas sp. JS3066]
MIVVVDYGAGNIASVMNMLRKVGAKAKVSNAVADIAAADKLILPGVGSFDAGMSKLSNCGLIDVLNTQVLELKKPILGICLGAQMLGKSSEEGELPGLGWVDMDIVRFEPRTGRKVPHMGWNYVKATLEHPILDGLDEAFRFYFVHGYYMRPNSSGLTLLTADYDQEFTAAVVKKNIVGVQFHPEKSHKFGMALLKNFWEKC